jgi:hypothetical protein
MKSAKELSPKSVVEVSILDLSEQRIIILKESHGTCCPLHRKFPNDMPMAKEGHRGTFMSSSCSFRSVWFAPKLEQVRRTISRGEMSSSEIKACWWTVKEQETTKNKARSLVLYTQGQGRSFVNKTFARSLEHVFSLADSFVLQDENAPLLESNSILHSTRHLREWMNHCNARRGLEKYIVDLPGFTNTIARHRSKVLTSFEKRAVTARELGFISARSSLASRIFARMKGVEDAHFIRDLNRTGRMFTDK